MSFKHFCIICERILECLKFLNIFLKLQKLQNDCKACKHFCIISRRLLECLKFLIICLKLQKLQNVCKACEHICITWGCFCFFFAFSLLFFLFFLFVVFFCLQSDSNWTVCKNFKKYSEAWGIFQGLQKFQKNIYHLQEVLDCL